MPLGSKKKGAKNVLHELEKTHGFVFSNDFILPPEFNSKEQRKLLEKVFKKNVGFYKLSEEEQKSEASKMEILLDEMEEKIKEYGGSIQPYVGSEGGNNSGSTDLDKKSNTDYVVIKINNVLIFEPFGQANNATFIGNAENDKLQEQLKKNGRLASIRNELLGRVFHTRTDKKRYDYESGHILEIMKLAKEYPQELLDTLFALMKEQDYCMLSTLDSKIPGGVDEVIKAISDQVKQRGITAKDVADVGSDIENKIEGQDNSTIETEGVEH